MAKITVSERVLNYSLFLSNSFEMRHVTSVLNAIEECYKAFIPYIRYIHYQQSAALNHQLET